MALQSSFYIPDGSTKTYPSTKHIATKQHVAVYFKRVLDSQWFIVPVDLYSLINQSVVFDNAPDVALYSEIEIRVADTADELEDSPSDIAIVAGIASSITEVANNTANVNTVATNINAVNSVSANNTNVTTVAGSIASVNTVAPSIANVNTVAGSIADINSVATTIVPNIAEILLADDNATIATTQAGIATTQAGLATDSATEAEHWANYTVDVAVPEGTGEFSAKHYATKAQQALAGFTVDATPTDGSTNAVSSNGVFDALAGKSDTAHTHATYLALAGGTMTGAITALRETRVAMGANNIDLSAGNLFTKTISGATTLTVSNWLASGNANSFILELTNGGSAVITYPSGSKFAGGTAFTLTASGKDILGCYSHDGGTTLNWILLAKDVK